jgi:DNA gyrase subunit A
VKKTKLSDYNTRLSGGIIAIKLDDDDALRWVKVTDGHRHVVLATHDGMSIRFSEEEARSMGRVTAGVRGIELRAGDRVVGVALVRPDQDLLAITEKGYGKRTPLTQYKVQHRGGIGIKTVQITEKNGPLVDCKAVDDKDEVLFVSSSGQVIRSKVIDIRETGRSAQGVRIMRMGEDIHIAGVAVVVKREEVAADVEVPEDADAEK